MEKTNQPDIQLQPESVAKNVIDEVVHTDPYGQKPVSEEVVPVEKKMEVSNVEEKKALEIFMEEQEEERIKIEQEEERLKNLPPIVEFRNVSKIFNPGTKKEFKALENLNAVVHDIPNKGEIISIVGPSGCGKSTAINLLAGFQSICPPTTGQVLVNGDPVKGPGIDRGMIFQKYSSFPHLTVLQNVCFGMEINKAKLGMSSKEIVERAREKIVKVGLGRHENKHPNQLSGGQQQRLAIARTLVLKPRIILMDEPTRIEMQRMTVHLWEDTKCTIFIITHSLIEAVYLSDRVWIFSNAPGRIIKEISDVHIPSSSDNSLEVQKCPKFMEKVDEVSEVIKELGGEEDA